MEEPVRETGVPEAGAILASAPAKPAPAQPAAKPAAAPATKRAALTGATDVLILASNGSATRSPVRPANRSTGGASISSGSFAGGKEVGSLSVTHNFNWFPESENQPTQVNQTKQAANKLVGGKREGQANEIVPVDPENPVEHESDKAKKKSSDKLDPDELKAKLEKRFNQ